MKKNNHLFILVFACMFTFTSCKKNTPLRIQEYSNWLENPDNGTLCSKEMSDYKFSILYKPVEYILANELKNNAISEADISKRREELKGHQYYTLRINSENNSEFLRANTASENEYYKRLEYFTTEAQYDIKIVEGKDTIPCTLYHFERNYGISPFHNIVLAFEEHDPNNVNDKLFVFNDRMLGIGKIAIRIKAEDINDIPKLKI